MRSFGKLAASVLFGVLAMTSAARADDRSPWTYWLGGGGLFLEADEANKSGQLYEGRVGYDLDDRFTVEVGLGGSPFLEGNEYNAPSSREGTYQGYNSPGENWMVKNNVGVLYHLTDTGNRTDVWDPYLSAVAGISFWGKIREATNWSAFGGPGLGVSYWFDPDFAVRADYNIVVAEDHDAEINHHALFMVFYRFDLGSSSAGGRDSSSEADELGAKSTGPLRPVYFNFDRSDLSREAKETLRSNAEWLKANPNTNVSLEGHCDERGTNEYNMGLGERRASSTKEYLRSLGIPAEKLSTVSYGEEIPADAGHNEEAWAKNRRVECVIKK